MCTASSAPSPFTCRSCSPRATGAGFCYNIGRLLAAGGPFAIGLLFWVALVPLAAALVAPLVIVETRGRTLPA